jgi:RNA polymerase sigma factor (sigma-70 family)
MLSVRAMASSTANADPPIVENRTDDWRLLRRYVEYGSQEAFSELVRRHLSWVHATCRKALRDQQMAEDAAQAVFIILARRAESITQQTRLSGWLFNTARFVVKDARKQQARYRRREDVARELAAERMVPRRPPVSADTQAALDDALATLTERDRQALLMHFYEGLSLNEMADVLEIGKEGVKKRVARALGRLRKRLGSKRAPVATLLALVVLLRSRAASALPMGLNNTVVTAATTPGHASILAEWMARQGIRAAAGASGRLLRAALAAELLAAVTVVGIWSAPKAAKPTAAPAGQVAIVAPTWRPPITASDYPAAAPQPIKPFVTTTTNEPPYRSGADDPEPKPSPLARGETTAKNTQVAATPAPAPAGPARAVANNTIYAGVAPVSRTFATEAPPAPVEVHRALPMAAAPMAVAARPASASARPTRAQDESTAPSSSPSPSLSPSAEHVVAHCLDLLPHPGERARNEIDGWLGGRPNTPMPPHPTKASGKPVEVAFSDHDRGDPHGHIRRMFIEDGDHPLLHHGKDRFNQHGLKPYLVVAEDDDDRDTLTGGPCPHAADLANLATTGDLHPHRPEHLHGNDGLCAPTLPDTVQPAAITAPSDFAPGAFQGVPEPGISGIATVLLSAGLLRRRRRN